PKIGKRCSRIRSAVAINSPGSTGAGDGKGAWRAGRPPGGERNIARFPRSWRNRNRISWRLRTVRDEARPQQRYAPDEQRAMMRGDAREQRNGQISAGSQAAGQ